MGLMGEKTREFNQEKGENKVGSGGFEFQLCPIAEWLWTGYSVFHNFISASSKWTQ